MADKTYRALSKIDHDGSIYGPDERRKTLTLDAEAEGTQALIDAGVIEVVKAEKADKAPKPETPAT